MMGLIEKSSSDSKACLLSSSSSTPVVFPFSILQWYLRSLAGSEWTQESGEGSVGGEFWEIDQENSHAFMQIYG